MYTVAPRKIRSGLDSYFHSRICTLEPKNASSGGSAMETALPQKTLENGRRLIGLRRIIIVPLERTDASEEWTHDQFQYKWL